MGPKWGESGALVAPWWRHSLLPRPAVTQGLGPPRPLSRRVAPPPACAEATHSARSHLQVDDKTNTWQCSDGRRGQLEGGRRGAVMPAFLSGGGYVDSKGVVDAKAVARAASAAAAGWGRSGTGCSAPQATASSRHVVRRSFQPPQVKRAGQALLAAPKAPRRE